jgi:hypothetical protein
MKIPRYLWIGAIVLILLGAAWFIVRNGGDLFAQ